MLMKNCTIAVKPKNNVFWRKINSSSYKLLYVLIAFSALNVLSCSDSGTINNSTHTLIKHIDELSLDLSNDSAGYYSLDTTWVNFDNSLNNIEISFTGETDSIVSDCNVTFDLHYFIDSVHMHIYSYGQFGKDSINRFHDIRLNISNYRTATLYYQFIVFMVKKNQQHNPAFIRLRDINIYRN